MKLWRVVVAAGLFVAFVPPAPAGAATRSVSIPNRSFSPQTISIAVGDTVRWTNNSGDQHTVTATSESTSLGESFDSSPNCGSLLFSDCLRPGRSFSHTFTTHGTFTYYCRRHGSDAAFGSCGMCGQVVVVRKPSSTNPPTTPASPRSTASASASPSVSPSVSSSASPSGTALAGPGGQGGSSGTGRTIAIAGFGVALLGASGYAVYRTMIRS